MNKKLLKELYTIHAHSRNLQNMQDFLMEKLEEMSVDVYTDEVGNIYAVKGESDTYPCLACHIDQVQHQHSDDFVCIESHGVIFGYSHSERMQQGLGADDKNGIFICLEMLKEIDVLKCVFFVDEEIGCIGSSSCDMSFFEDCRYIIEPDRRGANDLITSMFCGSVCSEDFIKDIRPENFGYKEVQGSITDVGTLVEEGVGISCLNLSCGYYEAHTDHEFTVLEDLRNCMNFVRWIILNITDVYPFAYTPVLKTTSKYTSYRYGDCSDWWSGYSSGSGEKATGISEYDTYTNEYDEDYATMEDIYSWGLYKDFDELYRDQGEYFFLDRATLKGIYDEIASYNGTIE